MNLDKNETYVSVGRGLGEFPGEKKSNFFVVVNGFQEFKLSLFEYKIWGYLHGYTTLAAWESAIMQKIQDSSNIDFPKILRRMIERNLFVPWSFSGMQDKKLINLYATRFGYAHGFVNNKWLVADSNAQKSYELSKDQYDVWNAAAGKAMLLEVIDTLMDQRGIPFDAALALTVKHGLDLYKRSLWSFDYVDAENLEVQQ